MLGFGKTREDKVVFETSLDYLKRCGRRLAGLLMMTKLRSVLPAVAVGLLGLPLPIPLSTPRDLAVPVLPSVLPPPLPLPALPPVGWSTGSALPAVAATPAASSSGAPAA